VIFFPKKKVSWFGGSTYNLLDIILLILTWKTAAKEQDTMYICQWWCHSVLNLSKQGKELKPAELQLRWLFLLQPPARHWYNFIYACMGPHQRTHLNMLIDLSCCTSSGVWNLQKVSFSSYRANSIIHPYIQYITAIPQLIEVNFDQILEKTINNY
jgi:hypothetical protein